ncbi:recombinase RecT [Vibrio agarivorans]|uniref:Recombinase RecT n=1 Tax=Vibrio agarivorans TaxID=153622 RepID=A0ABT7Y789_9VIBR|nr:recombinase RecT [Vibrio agarivorans]MDN2483927.1 recombinase RecT [Vibrio agarivorans]
MTMLQTMATKYGFADETDLMKGLKKYCFKYFIPTDDSALQLIRMAMQYDLNPFIGEIYPVEDVQPDGTMAIRAEIGFEGWLAIAKRNPQYKSFSIEYSDNMVTIEGMNNRMLVCHEYLQVTITTKEGVDTPIREYFDDNYVSGSPMWNKHPKRRLRQVAFAQACKMALSVDEEKYSFESFGETSKQVEEVVSSVWDSFDAEVILETNEEPKPEVEVDVEPETVSTPPKTKSRKPRKAKKPVVTEEAVAESAPVVTEEVVTESAPVVTEEVVTESAPVVTEEVVTESAPVVTEEVVTEPAPVVAEEVVTEPAPVVTEEVVAESESVNSGFYADNGGNEGVTYDSFDPTASVEPENEYEAQESLMKRLPETLQTALNHLEMSWNQQFVTEANLPALFENLGQNHDNDQHYSTVLKVVELITGCDCQKFAR